MIVDDNVPTSNLLDLKIGDHIQRDEIAGLVTAIEIKETDDYMMFYFSLECGKQIIAKKIRQVC